MISRKENLTHFPENDYESLKNIIPLIKQEVIHELFPEVFKELFMVESHQITINIVGVFTPYHHNKRKSTDTMLSYDNNKDFEEKESSKIINKIFEKHNIKGHLYLGVLNFDKID